MEPSIQDNIDKGLAEICRRENLIIASIGLILPYGLIVIWPASKFLGNGAVVFLFLPIFFYFKVFKWLSSTPCPRCGNPIGDFNKPRSRECSSCHLKIECPLWFGRKLTFTKVDYVPGLGK